MDDVSAARRKLKIARKQLAPREQRLWSARIQQHITHHLLFQRARKIGSYWATGGEVNLHGLRIARHQQLFLPVLQEAERPWCGRGLLFASGSETRKNRYGIPEPQGTPRIKASQLDYLLVPLVAFDRKGNRIGMGGGYYDRALAGLKTFKQTFKLGVAYSFQEVETITPQSWDIPLDGIVTEKELIRPGY
jgi:5-formyltetrahydrofolate cyclo-ligase